MIYMKHLIEMMSPFSSCVNPKAEKYNVFKVRVVIGRCRYFASVSVFVFLVGFYKSRFSIRYRFLKYRLSVRLFGYRPMSITCNAVNPEAINKDCM